ncbi:sensor histidine kinase [Floridanema aerugineum]|uniref:histidine kinase n=1 Tax=Floridaenema aerugineum BLCC-F46 TaxID=3153654 RepID=A0ABV4XHC7_9CYAN
MTFEKPINISENGEKSQVVFPLHLVKQKSSDDILFLMWVRRFISRLSIAKKISYGYALVIGVAVCGTTIGLLIGDYYQKQAQKQLAVTDQQQYLISELENGVSQIRSHPQRLVSVLGESIWFDYESANFFGSVNRVKNTLLEFDQFGETNKDKLVISSKELKKILQDYQSNTEAYTQLIQQLWQQIDPANLKVTEISNAKQEILTFMSGKSTDKVNVQFDRLGESLTRIKKAAEAQQIQANQRLIEAENWRLLIIITSMLLSVAIAIVLGYYTSRQIANPVETLNQVAQRVTKQSNFQLMAPVATEDEIGSLATSINQLVKWVGEYTHELELARQTLEQRVQERTEELQQALHQLKHTQSQLIQSEKMSSLGQLVAGVAHEINNPVNFIYGNIQYANTYAEELLQLIELYQQEYPQPTAVIQDEIAAIDLQFLKEDFPKVLSSMKMGTERIRQIILSLRNFSRLDEAEIKAVDIHEGIENTLLILNNRLKRDIEVVKNYGSLPLIECYPAQLNQVFMNIMTNAIDALEEVKNSQFSGANKFLAQIVIQTKKVNNLAIQISIKDNGSGISPEIKSKLFDPFFTTKPIGKGTGLGLSICYQILQKHKGKIEVISAPGAGTEFLITLPEKLSSVEI